MFKNMKLNKKLTIVVASLALVAPLAMNNISAQTVASAKVRTHRVAHVHHYYKFAYNKKEYNKYMKLVRHEHKAIYKEERKLNYTRHNALYRKGIRNALTDVMNKSLTKNSSYRAGYLHALALDHFGSLSKSNMKHARGTFKEFLKYGTNGNVYSLYKGRAHMNLL